MWRKVTLGTFGWILVVLLILLTEAAWTRDRPRQIKPGCRYEGRKYQEGTPVSTSEPCLQCRCTDGALRCRLRVCPRLPSPPPSGCRVRSPGENVCCAELVCGEARGTENTLRRSNAQLAEESRDEESTQSSHSEGCLHEGVRYGPGSAMMGSRRCEYCYCISGARRCITPKCLLPLPGCTPLYAPHSCCPVAYNCTHFRPPTLAPVSGNGCSVGSRVYEEGEMVRDIQWKASCDNCFCAMGAIRCVPLACAPPLQGCSPIVREGHCCPSTYNCSGSIEVKATQNYASYAFISKDYAKFRKETNFFTTDPPVEGRGHRVVEERIDSTSTISDLEEESSLAPDSTVTSWPSTFETNVMDNEILTGTMDYAKSSPEMITTAPTLVDELTVNTESTTPELGLSSPDADSVDDAPTTCSPTTVEETAATTTTDFFDSSGDSTATESTTLPLELTESKTNNGNESEEEKEEEKTNVIERMKITIYPPTTFANPTNITFVDKIDFGHVNLTTDSTRTTESTSKEPVTKPPSTILIADDILVMNVTVKTNVSVGHIQGVTINPTRSIPPDVEAILNITHREKSEDYDYDYSEPTLPPSLPNVRIIPFVAADALVKDKTASSAVTGYPSGSVAVPPEMRPTDASGFYDIVTQENRFSPPVETEGGFVPREPPYFDASYHSTDLNPEIGTRVTADPATITNPHRKNDAGNCLLKGLEYRHGDILPSDGVCIICMCYYGEVVCSSEKCPPLKIGCRRITSEEACCGKIICVAADESPTVVLDRADATAPSHHQPMVSPDPFRDVIKTKPAPDLPSLIEDMIPYLVEHGITTPRSTSTSTLKPIQNFDYIDKLSLMRPPYDYRDDTADEPASKKTYSSNPEVSSMDTISSYHNSKDPTREDADREDAHQTLDRVSESLREDAGVGHDGITSTILDLETMKKHGNPYSSLTGNATESNSTVDANVDPPVGSKILDHPIESNLRSTTTRNAEKLEEDHPIFSLDSVLDLLFSSEGISSPESDTRRTSNVAATTSAATSIEEPRPRIPALASVTFKHPETPNTGTESPAKHSDKSDNDLPASSSASLLKLAGCNIYGRMYRVGRIITELSGPCLECRCTEIGVQCKQLEC